ncbi:hypothetical protein GCM10027160_23590 [Streptomyces calidiresistens]|uniref:Uncharacterized protein n=1 Tax=Streptomyces calidiresistens TaxID=1485586 RepID=A0A7W3XXT3_9ACTN|nr:hypothetical protein [Streptomyces calidiresistens]MBB0231279.1 hypothetical protein [Streptomyces calidiresistens]
MAHNPPADEQPHAHRPTDPLAYFTSPGSPEHEYAAHVHRTRMAALADTRLPAPARPRFALADGPEDNPEREHLEELNLSAQIAHADWEAHVARRARHAAIARHTDQLPENLAEDLTEGREALITALGALADVEQRPRLRKLYRDLRGEVYASTTGGELPAARANFAYRRADDYYRRRWDEASTNPVPDGDEHLRVIGAMYRARRAVHGWRWPGAWDASLGRAAPLNLVTR